MAERADAQPRDPNEPASYEQIWVLTVELNLDVSGLGLTIAQATKLLNEVVAGREPAVRAALLQRGAVSRGKLPEADDVRFSSKLGRPVAYLPRGMEIPPHLKATARTVPRGVLIEFVTAPPTD